MYELGVILLDGSAVGVISRLILTTPNRYGFSVALDDLVRDRWTEGKDPLLESNSSAHQESSPCSAITVILAPSIAKEPGRGIGRSRRSVRECDAEWRPLSQLDRPRVQGGASPAGNLRGVCGRVSDGLAAVPS